MYSPINREELYEILEKNEDFKRMAVTICENVGYSDSTFYDVVFDIPYSNHFSDYVVLSKPNIPIPIIGFLLELIFTKTAPIEECEIRYDGIYYDGNRLPYDVKVLSNEESKKIFEDFLNDIIEFAEGDTEILLDDEDIDEETRKECLNFKNNIVPKLKELVPKIAEYLVYDKGLFLIKIKDDEYIIVR